MDSQTTLRFFGPLHGPLHCDHDNYHCRLNRLDLTHVEEKGWQSCSFVSGCRLSLGRENWFSVSAGGGSGITGIYLARVANYIRNDSNLSNVQSGVGQGPKYWVRSREEPRRREGCVWKLDIVFRYNNWGLSSSEHRTTEPEPATAHWLTGWNTEYTAKIINAFLKPLDLQLIESSHALTYIKLVPKFAKWSEPGYSLSKSYGQLITWPMLWVVILV